MSNKPKRLLEKYDVLLENLDYGYIGECTDNQMLEKIVKILRSGQEGYYPDLTSFAERRLRSVKPNSKLLREETALLTKDSTTREYWEKLNEELALWESDMQQLHKDILDQKEIPIENVPPIRTMLTAMKSTPCRKEPHMNERIESCDYSKWDRYNADAEILKMELDDERKKEFIMEQNRKNSNENFMQEDQPNGMGLSKAERMVLAIKHKEKGNDYFRSKEYNLALKEYNRSITMLPTAACFNNRAITNIKLKRYNEAVSDSEACLEYEPRNLKALNRKAQALRLNDKGREAYQTFLEILLLDPNNKSALDSVDDLRCQFPDLPPPNAFQFTIQDVTNGDLESADDYATLIKPKKIVKDRLPDAMKSLRNETAKMMQQSVSTKIKNDKIEVITRSSKKAFIEEIK